MLQFRCFGIPVRVQPWFWLTLLVIGGGLSAGSSAELLRVAMFMIAGFLSILIHEMGHAGMVRRYGLPTDITLVAFGGFASFPSGKLNRKQSFLVTAAGPGVQLAFGLAALALLQIIPVPGESLFLYLVVFFVWVSLFWAVFNCLPIHPMDGGQMLAAILGPRRQRTVFAISAVCAILIGLLGYALLRSWLIPIFMALLAYKNIQDFQALGTAKG